jgi:hypothetical protein
VCDRGQIIAVQGDVENAEWNLVILNLSDLFHDALGQDRAAPANADYRQAFCPAIAFDYLVRNPYEGSPYRIGFHYLRFLAHVSFLSGSRKKNPPCLLQEGFSVGKIMVRVISRSLLASQD